MNQSFLDVLELFSCGATGRTLQLSHELDVEEIRKLSKKQGIWPLVFSVLQPLTTTNAIPLSGEKKDNYKTEVMLEVATKTIHNNHNIMIFQQFREASIPFCLLKGESLSGLYREPQYRISSDTDILIPVEEEAKATCIMSDLGFVVQERYKTSHHICCYHRFGGLVELHLHLYDELFEDVWFDNKIGNQEPYRELLLPGSDVSVPVLGITDGYIFTVLHFIKHFLTRGVGIRQMMDTLLYALKNVDQIDWGRVEDLMCYLKYDRFLECVYQIGIRYLVLPDVFPHHYPTDETLIARILEDMANGGIFGYHQDVMDDFFLKYSEARFSAFKNELGYEAYIREWSHIPFKNIAFPSRAALMDKYPFVKKSPLLIAVAWLLRSGRFIVKRISGKPGVVIHRPSPSHVMNNDLVKTRMELIEDLNMI